MKYLLVILLFLTSCTEAQRESYAKQQAQDRIDNTKRIIAKRSDLGSHYNILTEKQVLETNYLLVAEDGSYVEVNAGVYETTQLGSRIYSPFWKY